MLTWHSALGQALDRLGEKEAYDRAFRIRVAIQQSMLHRDLPKEQWVKPEDVRSVFTLWSDFTRSPGDWWPDLDFPSHT